MSEESIRDNVVNNKSRQLKHGIPVRVYSKMERTCDHSRKEMMHGRKQALTYASAMRKMFLVDYNVYKCPFCNFWHITTQK